VICDVVTDLVYFLHISPTLFVFPSTYDRSSFSVYIEEDCSLPGSEQHGTSSCEGCEHCAKEDDGCCKARMRTCVTLTSPSTICIVLLLKFIGIMSQITSMR
jgi:hypothetical protein